MMCSCEEGFATRYLPHQISKARDYHTREDVPVTLGFQPGICDTCRGLPEEACPKKPMYGSTSKIARYYWREIQKGTIERFAKYVGQHVSDNTWLSALSTHRTQYDKCRREAIVEIKELHKRSPKYTYDERSQDDVIRAYGVQVIRLDGTYGTGPDGRPRLQRGAEWLTPEQYVAAEFQSQGFEVLPTESVPFHVLFGVMMWLLIQDPADPRVRPVSFGDRTAFEEKRQGSMIHTFLPEDFGTPGYALRRADAIAQHMASLSTAADDLLWTFDYWLEPSADLRQYLWAHRSSDVEEARKILSILPGKTIARILEYLVGDYWGRYCGWPDLLLHRSNEFCFVEVKSSNDKLSEDQKSWIQGNAECLGLPFKIVKIHRALES